MTGEVVFEQATCTLTSPMGRGRLAMREHARRVRGVRPPIVVPQSPHARSNPAHLRPHSRNMRGLHCDSREPIGGACLCSRACNRLGRRPGSAAHYQRALQTRLAARPGDGLVAAPCACRRHLRVGPAAARAVFGPIDLRSGRGGRAAEASERRRCGGGDD